MAVADADTTESSLPFSSGPPSLSSVLDDDASDAMPPWMFKEERGRKKDVKEGKGAESLCVPKHVFVGRFGARGRESETELTS